MWDVSTCTQVRGGGGGGGSSKALNVCHMKGNAQIEMALSGGAVDLQAFEEARSTVSFGQKSEAASLLMA